MPPTLLASSSWFRRAIIGAACGSVTTPPAMYPKSFAVGATTSADALASFSSRGPASYGGQMLLKPDVAAPGVAVRSSFPDGGYGNLQGTSMAGPHVAGVIALLLDAEPALRGQTDLVKTIVQRTTDPKAIPAVRRRRKWTPEQWLRLGYRQRPARYRIAGATRLCGRAHHRRGGRRRRRGNSYGHLPLHQPGYCLGNHRCARRLSPRTAMGRLSPRGPTRTTRLGNHRACLHRGWPDNDPIADNPAHIADANSNHGADPDRSA